MERPLLDPTLQNGALNGAPSAGNPVDPALEMQDILPLANAQGPPFTVTLTMLPSKRFGMAFKKVSGRVQITGFTRGKDGMVGPAEACDQICPGDFIISVNGQAYDGWEDCMSRLRAATEGDTTTLGLTRSIKMKAAQMPPSSDPAVNAILNSESKYQQPAAQQMPFNSSFTTQTSRNLFDSIRKVHKSGQRAQAAVRGVAQTVASVMFSQFGAEFGESMDCGTFLAGLLFPGEHLAHYGLEFMEVNFHNPNASGATVSGPLGNGRIALTSQRILLLCNSNSSSNTLAAVRKVVKGSVASRPFQYTVTSTYDDHRFYFPINISSLVHLKFAMRSGYKTTGRAESSEPGCCSCCCGQKNWWVAKQVHTQRQESARTLRLAVHLPPWDKPCDMVVQLKPTMTLESMKRFVILLQGLMHGTVTPEAEQILRSTRGVSRYGS